MFVRCLRQCVNGWGRRCAAGVLPVWQYYAIPAGHRRHAAHRRPHPFTHRRKYYAWGPMCRCADVADALITDTGSAIYVRSRYWTIERLNCQRSLTPDISVAAAQAVAG